LDLDLKIEFRRQKKRNVFSKIEKLKRSFSIMKKSRKELAREIIANLRRGLNRPLSRTTTDKPLPEATPFLPQPLLRAGRPRQLQTSHSH
jgi:hypothetical protein